MILTFLSLTMGLQLLVFRYADYLDNLEKKSHCCLNQSQNLVTLRLGRDNQFQENLEANSINKLFIMD